MVAERFDMTPVSAPGAAQRAFVIVLIALNAADLQGYATLKADLAARGVPLTEATEADFAPHRERDRPGVEDLFTSLVSWLEAHPNRHGGQLKSTIAS